MATLDGLVKDLSPPATDTQTSPITIPNGTTLITTLQHNKIIDYLSGDNPSFFIPQAAIDSLVTDLAARELLVNKGGISGYAGLNASQELLLVNFPSGAALEVLRRNAANNELEFATLSDLQGVVSINADTTAAQLIVGTTNVITVGTAAGTTTIDIDSAYVGQTSITTLGTISTGVWQGTTIDASFLDIAGVQTPWLQDINANFFTLTDLNEIDFGGATAQSLGVIHLADDQDIGWRNAAGNNDHAIGFNVTDDFDIRINVTTEYEFGAAQADFLGNSLVNAPHNHQDAPGGGTLTATLALDATGTKDSTTFLRGDDTWAVPAVGADGTLRLVKLDNVTISTDREGLNFVESTTISFLVADDVANNEAEVIANIVDDSVLNAEIGVHTSSKITITAKGQLNSAIVYNDQANVFGAFLQNFAASSMRIPLSATPTMAADGDFAIDTTVTDFSHGIIKYFDGEELGVVSMPIAQFGTPTDGDVIAYNAATDEFELVAAAGGGGDMVLADVQTVTGAKTFLDTTFFLRNVANTFSASFVNTITADIIYTLPDAAGTIVITGLASQITLGVEVDGSIVNLSDVSAKTGTGTTVVFDTSPTIITPIIASFATANHDHTAGAGGGNLTNTALTTGVFAAITGVGIQTQALDMGGFNITNLGNLNFTDSASVINWSAGESISIQGGGMFLDVQFGEFFSWDVDGTPEMTLTSSLLDLMDNSLTLGTGIISFSAGETIGIVAGDMIFDVPINDLFEWRIDDALKLVVTDAEVDVRFSKISNIGVTTITDFTTVSAGSGDFIWVIDATDGQNKKVDVSDFLDLSTIGVHDIGLPATAYFLPSIEPATGLTNINFVTNNLDKKVFEFLTGVDNRIQTTIYIPRNWDAGNVDIELNWSFAAGTGSVRWGMRFGATSDDEAIDNAFGAASIATDAAGVANELQKVVITNVAMPAGTVAGDEIQIEVFRQGSNPGDTFTDTARLHGTVLRITTNAAVAA